MTETPPNTRGIVPGDYPQLRRLAWNRRPGEPMDPRAVLSLYEREWRHVDVTALTGRERRLLAQLVETHGNGVFLPTGDTHGLRPR